MIVTVHLARHGESVWNIEDRYQGHADSGLTALGRQQAEELGMALARMVPSPDLVLSSDLPRAVATSRPYAERVGAVVRSDAALREVNVGDWSGRKFADVAAECPDTLAAIGSGVDLPRGGGETFGQVRDRLVLALAGVTERLGATGDDGVVVVFTHGGPIRLAAAAALKLPSPGHAGFGPPDNCSVTTINYHGGGPPELVRYNHPIVDPGAWTS
jgi:probable phosphoglycerate mutase